MNSVDHVPNPSKSEIKSVFLLSKIENEIYRAEMKNKYVISTWLGRATLEIVARSRKYKIWMRKKGMFVLSVVRDDWAEFTFVFRVLTWD